jgi:phosphate/sulfate permease
MNLVLLSKKPAVMLWLATPSLCSAEALTCSSTVRTFLKKKKKEKRTIQKHKQMNIEKERNKTSVATAINLL